MPPEITHTFTIFLEHGMIADIPLTIIIAKPMKALTELSSP